MNKLDGESFALIKNSLEDDIRLLKTAYLAGEISREQLEARTEELRTTLRRVANAVHELEALFEGRPKL